MRTVTLLVAGGGGLKGLPEPGTYYIRLFPDIQIVGLRSAEAVDASDGQSLPLSITTPNGTLPRCKP